ILVAAERRPRHPEPAEGSVTLVFAVPLLVMPTGVEGSVPHARTGERILRHAQDDERGYGGGGDDADKAHPGRSGKFRLKQRSLGASGAHDEFPVMARATAMDRQTGQG